MHHSQRSGQATLTLSIRALQDSLYLDVRRRLQMFAVQKFYGYGTAHGSMGHFGQPVL